MVTYIILCLAMTTMVAVTLNLETILMDGRGLCECFSELFKVFGQVEVIKCLKVESERYLLLLQQIDHLLECTLTGYSEFLSRLDFLLQVSKAFSIASNLCYFHKSREDLVDLFTVFGRNNNTEFDSISGP